MSTFCGPAHICTSPVTLGPFFDLPFLDVLPNWFFTLPWGRASWSAKCAAGRFTTMMAAEVEGKRAKLRAHGAGLTVA